MFGADTPLVWDAIQIAGLAAAAGAGLFWFLTRKRNSVEPKVAEPSDPKFDLEERVRVLERIATDRPAQRAADLADEIEGLRELEGEAR